MTFESDHSRPPATTLETRRPTIALVCVVIGLAIVALLHFTLPDGIAKVLLDRGGVGYPLSVQNAIWIVFTVGCGELFVRFCVGGAEARQLSQKYLPEDERTILQASDLGDVYRIVRQNPDAQRCFLPRLIQRAILQFQSSRSIDQASSLLNTSVEMYLHEVDLRYSMLRYLTWLIPSLGFIGTVVGIGRALSYAGDPAHIQDQMLLNEVTRRLAISFDGTFLALVMAALLVFLTNIAQSREEHALNLAGQYCLDNLINRLFVQSSAAKDANDRLPTTPRSGEKHPAI
jgi:biopolymer transport protein ExbB/TolQ